MNCKIRSWRVSYYDNDCQRWVYGQLTCSPFAVGFHRESVTGESQDTQVNQGDLHQQYQSKDVTVTEDKSDLLLKYTDIRQIQRAKSMWVFPAVTVKTHDGAVHWFSSLPDRHSVFNALDYFSRHSLLDTNDARKSTSSSGPKTCIGQQLLRSAEDSERTLAAAAVNLHAQGRQPDRAGVQLMEMHEDLDTADRLLSGLNTYLGQWSLPPQYAQVETVHVSKGDVSSDQDIEVLSSELSKDLWHPQQLSFLRITDSGLTLLNTRQRLRHSFRWMDLSRVFVVSPWEVVMTKHVAGRADISVSVVSAALLPVLQLLGRKVSHLMDYQTPPPSEQTAGPERGGTKTMSSGDTHFTSQGSARPGDSRTSLSRRLEDPSAPTQLQAGEEMQELVSETEVSALCSKLGGLKMMARAVGDELTTQNEALDDMISSVDDADSRIVDAIRRTKKLM